MAARKFKFPLAKLVLPFIFILELITIKLISNKSKCKNIIQNTIKFQLFKPFVYKNYLETIKPKKHQ